MSESSDKIAQRPTPNANPCPKFSIVIPAYNTEPYIARCLDSLVNQDTQEYSYEILITDDGSTDKTGTICDTYAAKYPFIHVTHTSNHGVSHARNIALEQCRGEYVMFCDSDDFVSPQLVSVVGKATEVFGRPDMIVYGLSSKIPAEGWPAYDVGAMSKADGRMCGAEEVCYRIFTDPMTRGYPHNKAVKRELALSARYDESLPQNEDELYWLSMLTKTTNLRACYLNYTLYCYVDYPPSDPTRNPMRNRTKDGYPQHLIAAEKMLALPNVPEVVMEQIEGRNYCYSLVCIFSNTMPISPEAMSKLKAHMRHSIWKYYFRYRGHTFITKIKTLVKHILLLFHIHKPRR